MIILFCFPNKIFYFSTAIFVITVFIRLNNTISTICIYGNGFFLISILNCLFIFYSFSICLYSIALIIITTAPPCFGVSRLMKRMTGSTPNVFSTSAPHWAIVLVSAFGPR